MGMKTTAGAVLLFNTRKGAKDAARLHAESCPMVSTRGRRVIAVYGDELKHEVADLEDRGFTVTRCKCLK